MLILFSFLIRGITSCFLSFRDGFTLFNGPSVQSCWLDTCEVIIENDINYGCNVFGIWENCIVVFNENEAKRIFTVCKKNHFPHFPNVCIQVDIDDIFNTRQSDKYLTVQLIGLYSTGGSIFSITIILQPICL